MLFCLGIWTSKALYQLPWEGSYGESCFTNLYCSNMHVSFAVWVCSRCSGANLGKLHWLSLSSQTALPEPEKHKNILGTFRIHRQGVEGIPFLITGRRVAARIQSSVMLKELQMFKDPLLWEIGGGGHAWLDCVDHGIIKWLVCLHELPQGSFFKTFIILDVAYF